MTDVEVPEARSYRTLTVIMPVFNERSTVAEVIRRMRAVELPVVLQIIVVDDGSTDGSDKVLRALEDSTVHVLKHEKNQGKGAAIRTGLAEARGDLLLIQDADLEYDPNDWPKLLEPLLRGKSRVVYGSRFTGERKNMLPLHWIGNRMLSLITNVLYSSTLSDMETCYKLFDAQVLEGITVVSNRFEFEPEITAKVLRRGYRIYEVPISYAGREPDEGKKITWRDGFGALKTLIKFRFARVSTEHGVTGVIGAVVVDHDTGPLLESCVRSILVDGMTTVVIVENGAAGSAEHALATLRAEQPDAHLQIVCPGCNVGFGAGVDRGLAALAGMSRPPEWILVANADLVLHPGASSALREALEDHRAWALVGPRIYTETGDVYPSVRSFPSFTDAAGHALLALFKPDNPFTKRYNPGTPDGPVTLGAGWVSGSCFLARRSALEELGGFDEAYFMYAEDMDLCWRAHHAGWGVGFAGTAEIMHVQGVSTARHPYKMMAAHHRSALRFTLRTTSGWRRLALPFAVAVLGVRMALATVRLAWRS